jgi:hypothetical protein
MIPYPLTTAPAAAATIPLLARGANGSDAERPDLPAIGFEIADAGT